MTTILRPLPADLVMDPGTHRPGNKMSLLEMTTWRVGESWTDHPATACPVLAAFGIALWDRWPGADLARLAPYHEKLIGTRSTPEVERRRAFRAADWAVRRFAVEALRAAGLEAEAVKLQELSPIVDADTASAAAAAAEAAWAAAAWAAAAAAAWAAAAAAWAAEAAWAAAAWAAAAEAAWAAAAWAAAAWAAWAWAAWAEAARAAAREAAEAAEATAIWDLALLCFDDLLSIGEASA